LPRRVTSARSYGPSATTRRPSAAFGNFDSMLSRGVGKAHQLRESVRGFLSFP
jgi:hypothetical protein